MEQFSYIITPLERHIDLLISRYPVLDTCRQDITDAYLILEKCYENDHKLLIAGNGGSAADSEHIAGELMKRFKIARPVPADLASKLKEIDPVRGENLASNGYWNRRIRFRTIASFYWLSRRLGVPHLK